MKKIVPLNKLKDEFLHAELSECHRQIWKDGALWTGYQSTPRFADGIVLLYSDVIAEYMFTDGSTIRAQKGDCLYLPRGCTYTVRFSGGGDGVDMYTVNFLLKTAQNEDVSFSSNAEILLKDISTECFFAASELADMCIAFEQNQLKKQANLLYLLGALSELSCNTVYFPIKLGAELLEREWNMNCPIEKYARACSVSETSFFVYFRKRFGVSPVEYRNQMRIDAAKSMLKNSDLTVGEISRNVGFEDQYYFSRMFKKLTGLSPREYRNGK